LRFFFPCKLGADSPLENALFLPLTVQRWKDLDHQVQCFSSLLPFLLAHQCSLEPFFWPLFSFFLVLLLPGLSVFFPPHFIFGLAYHKPFAPAFFRVFPLSPLT